MSTSLKTRSPWVLRTGGGRISGRATPRAVVVCLVLALAAAAVSVVALATGEFHLSISEVLAALAGQGQGLAPTVVLQWRLPRVLMALLFGAALGISGGIFQSLTRNPLGSPDIIGFNSGAYTGALVVMLLAGGNYLQVAFGALAGGLATAMAVYLLAYRRGSHGFRLIIVGIGISAMLASVNHWIILKADLEAAMSAAVWGAGTLNGISWTQAAPAIVAVPLLIAAALFYSPRMRMLEMGDDAARALGVRAEPVRLVLLVLGVALTAAVTAAAGPIAFVALAAPQLARRLTGGAGIALVPAAFMGALVLAASDLAAQRLFSPVQLPVGVVTVCTGGLYLVWLLAREARKS